jgi:hypothetical protein
VPISDIVLIAGGAFIWYGVVGFSLKSIPYLGCRTRARRAVLFGAAVIAVALVFSGLQHHSWLTLLGLSALAGLALQAVAWGMNYGLQQPGGETSRRQPGGR